MKRSFETQKIDWLYLDNLIGSAINDLRDMRDVHGNIINKYHNLSMVTKHIDKFYNIKINITNSSTLSLENDKLASSSYKRFKSLYTAKANQYVKTKGNNYTFTPKESKQQFLLKAVSDLFRI